MLYGKKKNINNILDLEKLQKDMKIKYKVLVKGKIFKKEN